MELLLQEKFNDGCFLSTNRNTHFAVFTGLQHIVPGFLVRISQKKCSVGVIKIVAKIVL